VGNASGIGIGIGIGVVIGFGFAVLFGIGQGTTVLENIPILDLDKEPRFAELLASYDEWEDKTTVVLLLKDNDGKPTKANGDIVLTLCKEVAFEDDLVGCFTNDFTFKKDNFYTWQSNSGLKRIGVQFVTNGELYGNWWWQANADIITEYGTWEGVHTRFWVSDE